YARYTRRRKLRTIIKMKSSWKTLVLSIAALGILMVIFIISGTPKVPQAAHASSNGYLYYRPVTIASSSVSGTISNFPMLFSGTYSYLAASSSAGGTVQNGNGYDIAFASDSGCSSILNFQQVSYASST